MESPWDRLYALSRLMVPAPQDRIQLTWSNAPHAFAYLGSVGFMAYLARRRDTKAIRIALLPLILAHAITCTFRYANVTTPETLLLNWLRALAGFVAIALTLDCALSDTARLKVGESSRSLPSIFHHSQDERRRTSILPSGLADALEVQFTFRGIGWNYGRGVHIPPEYRTLDRGPFLWNNFLTFAKGYLAVDAVQAFFRYTPEPGAPRGASLWNPVLPPLQRYALSTATHLICGSTIQLGIEMLYAVATMIGVGLCGQSPSDWPPVYGNPWKSDSVHDLWAKQWHQILRRVFTIFGGIPGQWLAGRVGAVLGTFLASGLFHELGFYLVNRGTDHRVTLFFTLQGVTILLEKLFAKYTGRRVGGWTGRIWTYFWILVLGQMCTDAWLKRGLGHIIFIPLWMSPIERVFIPAWKQLS